MQRSPVKSIAVTGLLMLVAGFIITPVLAQGDGEPYRPELLDEQTYGTSHFLIHYTLAGEHAINPVDADRNGTPDYIDQIAQTLEYVWQFEVDTLGWAAPPGDQGEGGDARLDVYLENILGDGYAGYVDTADGFIGDNPQTPEKERRAAYGYMGLDNDYTEVLDETDDPDAPRKLLQTTIAHEFNHMLQAGYDDYDDHIWLYEATATWMEDEVFDEVNDNHYYLGDYFAQPGSCLVSEPNWYADWLVMRLLSERYGAEIVRAIWEQERIFDGFEAIDKALAAHDSTVEEEMQTYVIANLLRDYEEGGDYPTVALETSLDEGIFSPVNGVQSFGADYIELSGTGLMRVSLLDADEPVAAWVIGIRDGQADWIALDNGSLVIDLQTYQYVYVIVHNRQRINPDQNCLYAGYTLDASPATGEQPSQVVMTLPANNFTPPTEYVGEVGYESDYNPPTGAPFRGEEIPQPHDLDVPFEMIIPNTPPPGYEYDFAYTMTAEEFGEFVEFYIPGGGISANFDYLNEDGDWLSILEAASPYTTLDEWLDDIDYDDPYGEIELISEVEVLVEDLSEPGDPWFSATLILNGLFIVIDGDGSRDDLLAMTEILIDSAELAPPPAGDESSDQPGEAGPVGEGGPEAVQTLANEPSLIELAGFPLRVTPVVGLCVGGLCLIGALLVITAAVLLRRTQKGAD